MNIIAFFQTLWVDVFSAESFYQFIGSYHPIIIFTILTASLAIIKMNVTAFVSQIILFIGFWLQHWIATNFFLLYFLSDWFFTLNSLLLDFLFVLQILSFVIILYELKKQIKEESKG